MPCLVQMSTLDVSLVCTNINCLHYILAMWLLLDWPRVKWSWALPRWRPPEPPHWASQRFFRNLWVTSKSVWLSMIPERLEVGFAAYLMIRVLDWAVQQTHDCSFLGVSRYFVFGNSAAFLDVNSCIGGQTVGLGHQRSSRALQGPRKG